MWNRPRKSARAASGSAAIIAGEQRARGAEPDALRGAATRHPWSETHGRWRSLACQRAAQAAGAAKKSKFAGAVPDRVGR